MTLAERIAEKKAREEAAEYRVTPIPEMVEIGKGSAKKQKAAKARHEKYLTVKEKIAAHSRARTQPPRTNLSKPPPPVATLMFLQCLDDADIRRAVEVHRDAMQAQTRVWDIENRCWIRDPDHKVRTAAAAFIIAHKEGLPVAKQLTLTASLNELDDALARLNGAEKHAEAIEIEASAEVHTIPQSVNPE